MTPRLGDRVGTGLRLLALVALTAGWAGFAPAALAADAPGSCGRVTTTSPKSTWLTGTIGSSTDVDWYRFSIRSDSRALITLGHLPADYDVSVYGSCGGALVASSHRGGTQFDEVYTYLPAGRSYVRVAGYAGAHSSTGYALRFRPVAWGTPVLSKTTWTDGRGYLHVVGEVLNNTAEPRRWIEIDATLRNAAGATIGSAVGYPTRATLGPWTRSPFEIVTKRPTGYASTSLKVCTPNGSGGCGSGQITSASTVDVRAAIDAPYVASGNLHYPGRVSNAGPGFAYLAHPIVTVYNGRGNVRGVARQIASPSTLAAGGTGTFDAVVHGTTTAPNVVAPGAEASAIGCSTTPRYTGGQENLTPPLARPSAAGRVALTFDMGGRMTPAVTILETLIANNVCATVFPTGAISQTADGRAALAIVAAHPELFEVGNHTMHHCDLVRGGGGSPGAADAAYCASLAPSPTKAEVQKELTDAEAEIAPLVRTSTVPFWRAPYGVSNATIRTWAAEIGWTKQWKWDVDTIDWKPVKDGGPTAKAIILKVVNRATSGSVVLMHLGGYQTPYALQGVIDGLRSRGFVLTCLSDLAA